MRRPRPRSVRLFAFQGCGSVGVFALAGGESVRVFTIAPYERACPRSRDRSAKIVSIRLDVRMCGIGAFAWLAIELLALGGWV